MKQLAYCLLIFATLIGCTHKNNTSSLYKTTRTDSILFDALYHNGEKEKLIFIIQNHTKEINLLLQGITGKTSPNIETADFLSSYFAEPNLHHLYNNVEEKYSNFPFNKTLNDLAAILQKELPSIPIPQFATHVSGLKQKILVGDSIISVSLDYYMGKDYNFYKEYFYPYQIQKMTPEMIFPDWTQALLITTFPNNNQESFLSNLIYKGKIEYSLLKLFPKQKEELLLGYTSEEIQWCKKHLTDLWEQIVSRDILFSSDPAIYTPFFNERPYLSLLPKEAPGNIGAWLGLQIIKKYTRKQNLSIQDLWNTTDTPKDILRLSEFNPQ